VFLCFPDVCSSIIAYFGGGIKLLEVYTRLSLQTPPLAIGGGTCASVGLSGLAQVTPSRIYTALICLPMLLLLLLLMLMFVVAAITIGCRVAVLASPPLGTA
jgi:hypothetical protein